MHWVLIIMKFLLVFSIAITATSLISFVSSFNINSLKQSFEYKPSSSSSASSSSKLIEKSKKKTINKSGDFESLLDNEIPTKGIIDYIGNTKLETTNGAERWSIDHSIFPYIPLTDNQLFQTRFNLWRQLPWKKINRKVVLKAKIGGSFPLESTPQNIFSASRKDLDEVESLNDLSNMFLFSANDPRILAIFIEIQPISCGYAKLIELKRSMNYFRKSGKKIYAFSEVASEKEVFLSIACDSFFMPPEGGLDLRGFSGGATFFRGIFNKIGIEPQVQRIGKYKSFGDTFNRTDISEAQREVVSSLLMESSDYWIDSIKKNIIKNNKTTSSTTTMPVSGIATTATTADTDVSGSNTLNSTLTDNSSTVSSVAAAAVAVVQGSATTAKTTANLSATQAATQAAAEDTQSSTEDGNDELMSQLWSEYGVKTPYDYAKLGLISGVRYYDQVEEMLQLRYRDRRLTPVERVVTWWHSLTSDTSGGSEQTATTDTATTATTDSSVKSSDQTSGNPPAASGTRAVKSPLLSFDRAVEFEMKVKDFDFNLSAVTMMRRLYTPPPAVTTTGSATTTVKTATAGTADSGAANATVSVTVPDTTTTTTATIDTTTTTTTTTAAEEPSPLVALVAAITTLTTHSPATTQQQSSKQQPPQQNIQKLNEYYQTKKQRKSARFLPAGLYLRKMRNGYKLLSGLPIREVVSGRRIAIINAVGGIASGRSGSGAMGQSLGSDSFIEELRRAKNDPYIVGVVIRVDSPGGSALASDVMWRELRMLSLKKPIVASQVDVAASGGYYLSMACDQIVAEDLTVTGSIGVVTAKFNFQELFKRIGYNVETISRGRYAEVLSSSRGFTAEEEKYFQEGAQKAYTSFITKAAVSRNMTVESMSEVAQGRVWTGRQALQRGLVDHIGGLWRAVEICSALAETNQFAVSSSATPTAATTATTGATATDTTISSSSTATCATAEATTSNIPFSSSSSNSGFSKSTKRGDTTEIRIQTFKPQRSGFSLPFGIGSFAGLLSSLVMGDDVCYASGSSHTGSGSSRFTSLVGTSVVTSIDDRNMLNNALYICDDVVATTGMASSDSLGVGQALSRVGCGPLLSYLVKHSPSAMSIVENIVLKGLI